jgi:hypothetical protein
MNLKELENLARAGESIADWFRGEFMSSRKEPVKFLKDIQTINLPKYVAGTLYRWTWLKKKDMQAAKSAKKISIKSGKSGTQSWTDSIASAIEFYEEIGRAPRWKEERTWEHGIVGAVIPGNKILCFEHDLLELYNTAYKEVRALKAKDLKGKETVLRYHGIPQDDFKEYLSNQISDCKHVLEEYINQREWVVKLDNALVQAVDIHVKGWTSVKSSAETPDHVIIVIDDPDTGESHVEFPDSNVVPFNREEPLQQAASFTSKLLKKD